METLSDCANGDANVYRACPARRRAPRAGAAIASGSVRLDWHEAVRLAVFRKLASFLGPGYLVAVGYMDPGNWATSLAGGSKFGYALLTVALRSNMMATLPQALRALALRIRSSQNILGVTMGMASCV